MKPFLLTEATLLYAVDTLADRDPALGRIVARYGRPPLWAREPGFPTLVHILLEQQVSLASARAAFDRLRAAVTPLTPTGFLALDDAQLKAIGFSRQKTRYGRAVATAVLTGGLNLGALAGLDDEAVRRELTGIVGIGDWTADIYLLMALRRPDAFPRSYLALQVAAQGVLGLAARPGPAALLAVAEPWRPYRAAAARLLWHAYLSEKGTA